jgi:hypothetical protein
MLSFKNKSPTLYERLTDEKKRIEGRLDEACARGRGKPLHRNPPALIRHLPAQIINPLGAVGFLFQLNSGGNSGAALASGPAHEALLDIGQPHVGRPGESRLA